MYYTSDLIIAVCFNDIIIVNECVKNEAVINSLFRGISPISFALHLRRYNILEILVSNGANVHLRNTYEGGDETPLFTACRLRDKKAINILLGSTNLNIDQKDVFGRTALYGAVMYLSADIVELFLNRGAKLDAIYDKIHPLELALQHIGEDAKGVIQFLIRHGCLLDFTDEQSLKLAVDYGDRETFCLLVSAGFKVKRYDWLSYDKLPAAWQQDKSFCTWIDFIQKNPPSLLNISACHIRKTLSRKWGSLKEYHVKQLLLFDSLNSLILLN